MIMIINIIFLILCYFNLGKSTAMFNKQKNSHCRVWSTFDERFSRELQAAISEAEQELH